MSNLHKTQKEEEEEDKSDSDEDSENEEENSGQKPKMDSILIKHHGCVNRIRVSKPIMPNLYGKKQLYSRRCT